MSNACVSGCPQVPAAGPVALQPAEAAELRAQLARVVREVAQTQARVAEAQAQLDKMQRRSDEQQAAVAALAAERDRLQQCLARVPLLECERAELGALSASLRA
jgi:septal ring factor EnvC (AmiA/AmiB activator)